MEYKIFGFIKKCFFIAMSFFSYNVLNASSLEFVSMNIKECKTVIIMLINVNSK